jgi:glycosyltransferase involved in cell wall biosynthesis
MQSLSGIQELKKRGMRIVYDCDDDIFSIKHHNPAAHVFNPLAKRCAYSLMELADVVTTTTSILAKRFPRKDVVVIPNSVDTSTFKSFTPNTKRMIWAGSATHWQDFKPILPAIRTFLRLHSDWKFICMGYNPADFRKNSQVESIGWRSITQYVEDMHNLEADFAIIPLDNNDFNRAKSNLKWVEFSATGIPCILPNHEPYADCMGCEWAVHSTLWLTSMERMATYSIKGKAEMVAIAQQRIVEKYDIRKAAKQWEGVLSGEGNGIKY